MQNRPNAPDLVEAVAEWLEQHAGPALTGGAAFHARVAANALRIVARELRAGPDHHAPDREALAEFLATPATDDENLLRQLASRIRSGELDDRTEDLIGVLTPLARRKLHVANPRYLPG